MLSYVLSSTYNSGVNPHNHPAQNLGGCDTPQPGLTPMTYNVFVLLVGLYF